MKTMRVLLIVLTTACWLGLVDRATATPFDNDCGSLNNIDTDPATTFTCTIAAIGTITDLNVVLNIDNLSGTQYATDLQITLVHVTTGISVAVYLGPEVVNPESRMDATFDDEAVTAPPASGDVLGLLTPAGLLSDFDGQELAGDWRIEFLDTAFPDEGIDLISWRLTGSHVPEPGSAVLLSIGLFGLTILSGRKHEILGSESRSASEARRKLVRKHYAQGEDIGRVDIPATGDVAPALTASHRKQGASRNYFGRAKRRMLLVVHREGRVDRTRVKTAPARPRPPEA